MKYIELSPSLFKTMKFLSKKKEWLCYTKEIAQKLDLGLDRTYGQLRELQKLGYISKQQEGGGQGKTKEGKQRKLIIKILK